VTCTVVEAMDDPHLLGGALGDPAPWATWRVVLKAAFGLTLDRSERTTFAQLAGGRDAPTERVSELWAVAGRRGGKSRMAALLGAFLAAFGDHRSRLSPGETGYVLILAPSRPQAKVVRDYIAGFLSATPVLAQMIESESTEEIRLRNGVVIAVHAANHRSVRGRTLLACIFDEAAFWRDETSATPDLEIYRAVIPALATTQGMLIGISSPYRRVGLLHQKHRDHYGQPGDVLVIQAATATLNPTLDQRIVARAYADDSESAKAEFGAMFRSDIAALFDDAAIDRAIDHSRPDELPPREGLQYVAFVDTSAGRHDAATCCIGHAESGRFVVDVLRGRVPPFDPKHVAAEHAALAKEYRCTSVTGDAYAGEWVAGAFRDAGVAYVTSELNRSQLYLEALPHFARDAVAIPDHPKLIRELRLLERRTSRSGRDSCDHPRNGSDDFANAFAGALWLGMKARRPSYSEALYAAMDMNKPQRYRPPSPIRYL
jgi:hypothetical protein